MKSYSWFKWKSVIKINLGITILIIIITVSFVMSYIANRYSCMWFSNAFLNIACGLIGGMVTAYLLNYKKLKIENKFNYYHDFLNIWSSVDERVFMAYNKIQEQYSDNNTNALEKWVIYLFEKLDYYRTDLDNNKFDGIDNPYKNKFIKPVVDKISTDIDIIHKEVEKLKKLDDKTELLNYLMSTATMYYNMHTDIGVAFPHKELQEMEIQRNNANKSIL